MAVGALAMFRMFLNRLCVALLLLVLSGQAPSFGVDREILKGKGATVVFEPPLRGLAEDVLSAYPAVRSDLEGDLGWAVHFHPTIVLIPDKKTFQRITGKSLVIALAVPDRNLIVLDRSSLFSRPLALDNTLKHELCHLLLHSKIPGDRLPLWLDEGVAQWVSGGFSEISLPRRASVMDEALLTGRLIPIRALSRGFYRDGKTMLLAYEQSNSIVQHIIGRYGVESLLEILRLLAKGRSLEKAVEESLSLSLNDLEDEWKEDLEVKIAWFSILAGHLYEILFFLVSVAVMVGFVRFYLKKRKELMALDDEDGGAF